MKNEIYFENSADVTKLENTESYAVISSGVSPAPKGIMNEEVNENDPFQDESTFSESTELHQSLNSNSDSSHKNVTELFKNQSNYLGNLNKAETDKNLSNVELRPGECIMRTLFHDFTVQAARKMEEVMTEPLEKPLSKTLQRGEDAQFDQLIVAFGSGAEHCLPSLLTTLFAWYERQLSHLEPDGNAIEFKKSDQKGKSVENPDTKDNEALQERRDLAIEFMFCLVLIEVLHQLPVHPGHEDLINYIENISFKHFRYREGVQTGPNASNIHTLADLYAEVISILAQSRFQSVRKRFMTELKELRSKEPSPQTTQSIISLLMGMKFFRVKMVPIEEFEASFLFMQDCAQYFLEVKDKDIKHALAGLFVEILVPVAASVKNEVNVPCLKNFVESLYSQTIDMCTKSKHRLALFPLVTCLLCVSQKSFFLQNWYIFLAMCLSHLKNRDPKMSRVALESLYRLLWVYMIRIKCESNSATLSRLQSIVNSLFPKGSKGVVPRDTPLNIFVKIIQFIAQERLDFAMREIVFDLLSVGRPVKMILTPERMSIGLRAFLVVADSLQQKEGEPPMPRTSGVLPSGNTLRIKKTFLNKVLTDDTARSIGMSSYFPHVRRVFVDILRALDIHYGRPLMMTSTQNVNKEPDEMLTGERKPRIDLFRTCVAAVPRLIPEMMTGSELVDLLSRLTVHMDEELRALAYQSLQTLVIDFSDWRNDVIFGFSQFLAKDLLDTFPQLIDNGLRMLLQLLTSWKNAVSQNSKAVKDEHNRTIARKTDRAPQNQSEIESSISVFHQVEGLALVMLCSGRPCPRRLAVHILREIKCLLKLLGKNESLKTVIDVMDKNCLRVLEKCVSLLPTTEKAALMAASNVDLQWIAERASTIWSTGTQEEGNAKISTSNLKTCSSLDIWTTCMFNFFHKDILIAECPSAVSHAWPIVYNRIHTLFSVIDPTPVSDNRASLLRSSAPPRKPASERDQYMLLWRSYVIFAMRVVPPAPSPIIRCASPDLSLSVQSTLNLHNFLKHAWEEFESDSYSLNCITVSEPKMWRFRSSSSPDNMITGERTDSKLAHASPTGLYKLIVPLLRCEVVDVRDAAVYALSSINPDALKDLMEELVMYIRDAIDKKQENMRRRKRRDALRLQLVKVFELIAEHGTFGVSSCVLDRDTHSLHPTIIEYIDGARICLETEADKESLRDIKLHFCNFIRKMLKSFSLETYPTLLKRDLRSNLFCLFRNWSGPYGSSLLWNIPVVPIVTTTTTNVTSETISVSEDELQFAALQAMSVVLCSGPCFDVKNLLSEDGALYGWLNTLLMSKDKKVYQIAYETVILLLECNPDVGALLDWVVDRCFTAEPQVADGCFLALAVIFSAREYPCDHYTAIINVTLMNTGCPRKNIHETALQLLQVLDKRFFDTVGLLPTEVELGIMSEREKENNETSDLLLSNTYCCSQTHLSQQLSQLHPELTMPMFSEITHRFQTARPEVRQLLLQYILPWLHNMELVDPNISSANSNSSCYQYYANDMRKSGSRREGWGSAEATEMVLNNLFYITAKFSNEHSKEIEDVWATLCSCWPNNLKVMIRYLLIMCGMTSNELLPYAKLVVVYLARARPDKLIDEMLTELQTVETLNCLIERTETPPFYRLTSVRKISSYSDPDQHSDQHGNNNELNVEKGTIHTKRHSSEEGISSNTPRTCKTDDGGVRVISDSKYGTLRNTKSRVLTLTPNVLDENKPLTSDEMAVGGSVSGDDEYTICRDDTMYQYDVPFPHPLPMPEYGGYFAPLIEYIPENTQPGSGFHRCNLAVILLTDVVVDSVNLDWSVHIPLMLHILFLGMDQSRNLINQHCKQLLLNLLIVLANHADHLSVAQILLNRKVMHLNLGLPTSWVSVPYHNFTESDQVFDSYLQSPIGSSQSTSLAVIPSPTSTCDTLTSPQNVIPTIISPTTEDVVSTTPVSHCNPIQDVVKSLIDFISSKKDQVLWNYEDITAKVWSIRSVEQLDIFLQHVLRIFQESLPHALINERWAQTALHLGLSCSSRHYAGRSLQVFRFLRVPISSRMLSDILSRLVETIAEQGEDMQGYVTELLLTLESSVDSLESDFRPLDFMKEIFKSTPNLNKDAGVLNGYGPVGKRAGSGGPNVCALGYSYHASPNVHARSTSYSVSHYYTRRTAGCLSVDNKDTRREMDSRQAYNKCTSNLSRSRSAQSLKLLDSSTQDDKMLILAQLFWLAVSVLESDYEYEYLLALRLLNRVLHRLPLDRPDTVDKVEKLFGQLRWTSFQGVQSLLLKGCTNPAIYEAVIPLLSQFTLLLHLTVVDPTQNLGLPMNVMALLPYMLLHYEDANELCITSAENIAQVSTEKGKKLENLGTVMTLYSRRTFSKESFQWTKCVVKYLHDTYSHVSMTMLTFLVELLEKGPSIIQLPVLNVIHCMLHYVDLSPTSSQQFNPEVLMTIAKFVEGVHHKEATKILKLVVTRSSSLVAAPSSQYPFLESHYSSCMYSTFADVEVFTKKELPGRTMDFTFDLTQTPLIGKPIPSKIDIEKIEDLSRFTQHDVNALQNLVNHFGNSPRRSSSLSPADNAAIGWKRPWMSQSRVRECLVNLLTTCGQRVGLPKSPSEDLLYSLNKVIFSQNSDLLERQSSMASSTEEVSGPDLSAESRRNENDHFGVFKDFDFLEYESESVEGESTDNFNWGVRRRPLSGGDFDVGITLASQAADSLSEKTPLLTIRTGGIIGIDDSSDEELGSESPLDEMPPLSSQLHDTQSSSSSIRLRERRDSATRSDISDSSVGDLGDLTPCNASPNLPAVMSFRSLHRDDTEEMWRFQLCLLFEQTPSSSLQIFHLMYKLVKDLVNKSISVTHRVCNILSEFEGSNQLQSHLTTVSSILSAKAHPVFVWYSASTVPLTETLKFGLLQLREHLDTFLDRKDHANECVETLKAILKLQQLRDESVSTELVNEESVVDVGKALYKFHIQLLLMLETANKMYSSLIVASNQTQLENLSQEVATIRKSLLKAQEECSDLSEDGTPSPQLLFADQSDSVILQFLNDRKWSAALKFMRHNRITWLNEIISSSPDDEDEVINILTVYCNHLINKNQNAFVMIDSEDLSNIHGSLMDELMQLLVSLNETESKIKEQKEKNYASH